MFFFLSLMSLPSFLVLFKRFLLTHGQQDNGTQTAIQTIYRELDRAKTLIKKQAKQPGDEGDATDEEIEADWTLVEEGEEMDAVAKHMAEQAAMGGIQQDASRTGGGSLVLGSMVLKGGGGMRRTSE